MKLSLKDRALFLSTVEKVIVADTNGMFSQGKIVS